MSEKYNYHHHRYTFDFLRSLSSISSSLPSSSLIGMDWSHQLRYLLAMCPSNHYNRRYNDDDHDDDNYDDDDVDDDDDDDDDLRHQEPHL